MSVYRFQKFIFVERGFEILEKNTKKKSILILPTVRGDSNLPTMMGFLKKKKNFSSTRLTPHFKEWKTLIKYNKQHNNKMNKRLLDELE